MGSGELRIPLPFHLSEMGISNQELKFSYAAVILVNRVLPVTLLDIRR
jgi:hypothetical protein